MRRERTPAEVTDAEIARAIATYWPTMPSEDKEYVNSLSETSRRFFWAYLVAHEHEYKDQIGLERMQRAVERHVELDSELSATPFRDAEGMLTAHSYFRTSQMIGRW